MPDTITTTTPDGSTTRPVPPSWATVAPLLQRWQMALLPRPDGQWEIHSGYPVGSRVHISVQIAAWPAVPQAIADVAARCEAEEGEGR